MSPVSPTIACPGVRPRFQLPTAITRGYFGDLAVTACL